MHTSAETDRSRQIELILQQVESLPTLSPIAARLLEISSPQDADLDQIVDLIESDPALTAKVLGLCRRADRGLGERITTVRRAVVMLGLSAVQSAVLSVSIYELMDRGRSPAHTLDEPPTSEGPPAPTFDHAGFWKHCVAVAAASELIAGAHPRHGVRPEEAFVGGLLHDLGKLALEMLLPRAYTRVLGLAERRQVASGSAELEVIGLDHHTAGKRLAEHWGLPHALQDVMWLHGQPASSVPDVPHKRLIGVVGVARALCRQLHLGFSGDFGPVAPIHELCRDYGLTVGVVEGVVVKLHEAVAARCTLLGLNNWTTPELLLHSIAGANRQLARLNALFEQRSRSSQRQARVLGAIAAFHAQWRPGRPLLDTFGSVIASATDLFGMGFYAIIFQSRPEERWQLCRFAPDGSPAHSELVQAPAGPSLGVLADPSHLSVSALSLLPWLTDYLGDAVDLRHLRLLPLDLSDAGPSTVLLHDRESPDSPAERSLLGAMTSTWAAAIAASAQHDGARRLGERLAASNRTLAEMQGRLSEAQSLARLGEMAAGAAHEMNNPLTVISGRSQMLAASLSRAEDQAAAESIAEAAQRLSDLISALRHFADPPRPSRVPVAIDEVVRLAVGLAERKTGTRDRVRISVPRPTPEITADRELLAQALAEVVANGLEASSSGFVSVTVQSAPAERRLLIVIQDQGTGMSARALQHAFDPFFSDKPAGRGRGLGLARARRLIELHAGEISLSSAQGGTDAGTIATIALPNGSEGAIPDRHANRAA